MTFQMTDDMFTESERFRSLTGPGPIALHYVLGNILARHNTDGAVSPFHLEDAQARAKLGEAAAPALKELIDIGLLHAPGTLRDCGECKQRVAEHPKIKGKALPERWHYFHGFLRANLDKETAKDPDAREKHNRKKALHRDAKLIKLIKDRDGYLCRYCGERTIQGNQNGDLGATYDHVDPDGENEITNVVRACRKCNGRKGQRTPDEAGIVLRPPLYPYGPDGQHQLIPDPLYIGLEAAQVQALVDSWLTPGSVRTQPVFALDSARVEPGVEPESDPDSLAAESGPIPLTRMRATRDGSGPGRAKVGSGLGPRRTQVEPGFNPATTEGTDGLPPDGPASSATVSSLHGEGDESA